MSVREDPRLIDSRRRQFMRDLILKYCLLIIFKIKYAGISF